MKTTLFPKNRVFIVAELSANHNGSKEVALKTIKAAKLAGADAIKIQTYTADTITLNSKNPDFKIAQGTIWDGKYLHDLYQEAYTPWEWHEEIFDYAQSLGLVCFSSPFDFSAVDLLEKLDCPAYKIASPEITDIPLIGYVAAKKKPIIISTGIAEEEDIRLAIETCRNAGNEDITILQCTTAYPAPIEMANIRRMVDIKERFGVRVGLSDHTMGFLVPVVAAALGAQMIEKHFILDRSIGGPDASFSMDQIEFTEMVNNVRIAEKSLGIVDYTLTAKQKASREFARSLYVTENIKKGGVFSERNIRSVRPGFGLHPKHYFALIGKIATCDIEFGTALKASMIEDFDSK